ncbi:putative ubiquitin conjugation factor E4 [Platanthera guangdongensis]|uniref:Ubiquitin conjugation factor E4 n=1 Tax=Platanthera guangdongensis TaxID=2320717 RepID=A0ABR2LJ86_9ASPA
MEQSAMWRTDVVQWTRSWYQVAWLPGDRRAYDFCPANSPHFCKLSSEGRPLLLSRDSMERVLIDRLSGIFPSAEPPFQYLIGSFRRSVDESRRVLSMNDLFVFPKIESAIKQAKRILASYCRIYVGNLDMFAVGKPTTSELLDLISFVHAYIFVIVLNVL